MTNGTSTVNPSEVGWQFVPQYYTFVNKQPNRLHCFYTKASTFIHGTEGEDGKPCYGQQEIHNKITSIGFQDCKVFIHSVDAQSSANGGIIIQVIGEMSNKGEPWRKFVQTFFLAEQPNGYFVLNDIFRFLKEEAVDSDDQASEVDATAPSQQPQAVPPVSLSPTPPPPPAELQPEPPVTPTPPPASKPAEEAPVPAASSPAPEPQTNGVHSPEPEVEPAPAPVERSPSPAPEPPATASPPPVSPPAQHEPLPSVPAPAPVAAPPPAPPAHVHPPAPAPAAPQPMQPPQRKTWANLAAKDSNKWGAAVANEVRGVSEAPVTAVPAPLSGPQSPAPHVTTRPTVPRDQPHPALLAAQNVQTAQCFVKSVTENIPDSALRNTLIQRFGPVKELEILRAKACAFLEFTQLEAARRAIAASLPIGQGGEGGIRIDLEGGGQGRIIVETRKERGERPPPRGPPMNGGDRGRGGFRGRGGPGGGRGRGGPMPPK